MRFEARAVMKALEVPRLGKAAVNLHVTEDGRLRGRLQVGQGGLGWFARGTRKARRVPWHVFSEMIPEFPFGSQVGARLQFADGHLYWRAPGEHGRGRRITWADFVRCMDKCIKSGTCGTARPARRPAGRTRRAGKRSTRPAKRPAGPPQGG